MPKKVLTAASVSRLKLPATGQLEVFDRGYPGLYLLLSYGGSRAFKFVYRFDGKQRRLTLGSWPAMSLADARAAWRLARERIAAGEDPGKTQEPSGAGEFGAVAAEWLKRDQAGNKSYTDVQRLLEVDVLPHWRHRRVEDIGRKDVLELIDGVADRGSPVMARRLHAHLHRLFEWSVGRGIIVANPLWSVPKVGNETPRDRILSDAELAKVWQAAGEIGWPFGPVYQLLILTGARRQEIAGLRWSELDGDQVKLDGKRTKNGLPHTIPLSAPAAALLYSLPRAGDLIFTTNERTPISGWTRAKQRLDRLAGINSWHVHDVRRVVATGLQRLSVPERVIEACLGHSTASRNGLLRVYQVHGFDAEKRAALEAWGAHVMGLMGGSKVVAWRGAR